jgi:hypothetical protein
LVEEAYGEVVKIYEKAKMQVEGCVHEISWWLVVVTKKVIWEIFLTLVGMLQGFWEKWIFIVTWLKISIMGSKSFGWILRVNKNSLLVGAHCVQIYLYFFMKNSCNVWKLEKRLVAYLWTFMIF